ncbi:hypothetical protein GEMRC1_010148 [Eukaryota sp. GEM-RC1]
MGAKSEEEFQKGETPFILSEMMSEEISFFPEKEIKKDRRNRPVVYADDIACYTTNVAQRRESEEGKSRRRALEESMENSNKPVGMARSYPVKEIVEEQESVLMPVGVERAGGIGRAIVK